MISKAVKYVFLGVIAALIMGACVKPVDIQTFLDDKKVKAIIGDGKDTGDDPDDGGDDPADGDDGK